MKIRIVGPGRAGRSFARAWQGAGFDVDLLARAEPVAGAATGVDVVLIATPDAVIADVAAAIEPGEAVVLHCSGATGIDVLCSHNRCGSIHPLMALPDEVIGAERLASGGWFAVAGDAITEQLVDVLNGRHFHVGDDQRALYHATAAVAANHVVALLGQVERLAAQVGVPLPAFLAMSALSIDDVATKGAAAALTGPAARGDLATLDAHRAALPPSEQELYDALVVAAQALAAARST